MRISNQTTRRSLVDHSHFAANPFSKNVSTLPGKLSIQHRTVVWILVLLAFGYSYRIMASVPVMPSGGNTNQTILDSWSFSDTNNWTTDQGFYPISHTNIAVSYAGPGNSLLIDSSDDAWLRYNIVETSGATNLQIESEGSLMFWFFPNWASSSNTTETGYGPGVAGRFIEVGATNSPAGWWSLFVDTGGNNLYFSAQDGAGNFTNYLTGPIIFSSNTWHLVALSWTSTNTSLYVDGQWVINGPGLSVLPPAGTLTNGFTIGSDLATGTNQMRGAMNDLITFNYAIETNQVETEWVLGGAFYGMNPNLVGNFANAPSSPGTEVGFYNVVTGSGYLQLLYTNEFSGCTNGTGVAIVFPEVWGVPGSNNMSFMVEGGNPSWPYDVFAIGSLPNPKTNGTWTRMGQAYPCYTNVIYGFTNQTIYLMLGTPQDTDGDGLTDAYKLLVSHSSLTQFDTLGDGIPDAWKVLNLLSTTNLATSAMDPDGDGLSNLDEYLYGTNPQVNDGFAIWTSGPTASGIP